MLTRMRVTLKMDEVILRRAADLTGVRETTALVRMGLEVLIARENGTRLACRGGGGGR